MIFSMKCLKTGCIVKIDHIILIGDLVSDKNNLYLINVPQYYGNGDPNHYFDIEVKDAYQIGDNTKNNFLLKNVQMISNKFKDFNKKYNEDYLHLFN